MNVELEAPLLPRRKKGLMQVLGKIVLRLLGWRIEGELPNVAKAVLIAAPHTSNWDFVVGVAAMHELRLQIQWLGKDTLFRPPFDRFFRWMGGTPVDRNSAHGVVQETVDLFKNADSLLLGLSPEGTRKRVTHWRSGFYRIAVQAGVPILPVAFDYSRKRVVLGQLLNPADAETDFETLRGFYSTMKGKHPDNFSYEIRCREIP